VLVRRLLISWSSGKDAAWTLQVLRDRDDLRVVGLLSMVDARSGRVWLRGTSLELLALQSDVLGLPLRTVELPTPCSKIDHARLVGEALDQAQAEGIDLLAFGDLNLADVRHDRERLFEGRRIRPLFPLWGRSTRELALEMVDGGLRALITAVDSTRLGPESLGRQFDGEFLHGLPPDVDACGEGGGFHTFVYDGPMFPSPLEVAIGERWSEGDQLIAEPVLKQPIDGTLDLHTFTPRDVGTLVPDYVEACRRSGILQLRIVHGKGSGALRERVHAVLRRTDGVRTFRLGGHGEGGWGATLVQLAPWTESDD
jgi:uncharacterized protein (TIGR00290 family)